MYNQICVSCIMCNPSVCKIQACVQASPYLRKIPHVAHMKLNTIRALPNTRTRRSTILQELDRIDHRVRPQLSYVPLEDFLNSRAIVVSFPDHNRPWLRRVCLLEPSSRLAYYPYVNIFSILHPSVYLFFLFLLITHWQLRPICFKTYYKSSICR